MTPKEKAKELLNRMEFEVCKTDAKQCALIAVQELIESHLLLTTTQELEPSIRCKRYWEQVKQEIEKL